MKTKMPGSELLFTVVQKDMHYCGGTDKGCEYLQQTPWIPYSFLGSLASKPGIMALNFNLYCFIFTVECNDYINIAVYWKKNPGSNPMKTPGKPTQTNLRVQVEQLFNQLYGMCNY